MIIWLLSTVISSGQLPHFYEGVSKAQADKSSQSMPAGGKDFKSSSIYFYEYCNGCTLRKMSRKELIALELTKLIANNNN
jgi:hypothetical protein